MLYYPSCPTLLLIAKGTDTDKSIKKNSEYTYAVVCTCYIKNDKPNSPHIF